MVLASYPISTALRGLGERFNSFQTPRGLHLIRAKIGDGQPLYTLFKARRPFTTLSWPLSPPLKAQYPDGISTRILWLCGLEIGFNRLGPVDSFNRKIYIHGTLAEEQLGQPCSWGCIRMSNQAINELFKTVFVYTPLWIGD